MRSASQGPNLLGFGADTRHTRHNIDMLCSLKAGKHLASDSYLALFSEDLTLVSVVKVAGLSRDPVRLSLVHTHSFHGAQLVR